MKRPGHMHVLSEGAGLLPPGWHDEIVVHTMRPNGDGSITVVALVNVYAPGGMVYSTDRTMRLKKTRKEVTP